MHGKKNSDLHSGWFSCGWCGILENAASHHCIQVLRLSPGKRITFLMVTAVSMRSRSCSRRSWVCSSINWWEYWLRITWNSFGARFVPVRKWILWFKKQWSANVISHRCWLSVVVKIPPEKIKKTSTLATSGNQCMWAIGSLCHSGSRPVSFWLCFHAYWNQIRCSCCCRFTV